MSRGNQGTDKIEKENAGNKVRISHILYSGLGGHGSVFFSLVKGDVSHEFSVSALFCGIEKVRKEYVIQCELLGIPYEEVLKKRGVDFRSYAAIYKGLKKSKPDIIFLHGSSFLLPALFFKLFSRRVKLIVRDTQAIHLKSKIEWIRLRLSFYFSNHIVFLTKESMEGIIRKTGNERIRQKSVIIPNGVDTGFYKPALRDIPADAIIIGMQSRLQSIKDHPTLLSAFALLKEQFPELKLLLRIAGDGDTMASLKKQAADLLITAEVEFCGMLDEKDLLFFMQSLDIYVHASHGETMSNSIMQAMACGLPIIASDVWGINNMIRNNENGLLYKPGDKYDLCEKIGMLIDKKEYRQMLAENARAYAVNEFSIQRLFFNYHEIFN